MSHVNRLKSVCETGSCDYENGSGSDRTQNFFPDSARFPHVSGRCQWTIADENYELLRDAVLQLLDLDLNHYRTQQMERRLSTLLMRRGVESWSAYVDRLRREPAELAYFQEFITINVSSFYRDAEKWRLLRQQVLPDLLNRRSPLGLNSWSVGCSIGAEAYTLAMLLAELTRSRRHSIWATDIDAGVLERARAGGPYFQNEIGELPANLLETYMTPVSSQRFSVRPVLKTMTQFARFNLLQDETSRKFDLILCRNVVIYFATESKPQVYRRLARSLTPGGILFIGSTETIPNYQQLGFEYIAPAFYRYNGV